MISKYAFRSLFVLLESGLRSVLFFLANNSCLPWWDALVHPLQSRDGSGSMCVRVSEEGDGRESGIHCVCRRTASSLTLSSPGYKELRLMHQPPCSTLPPLPVDLCAFGPSYQQVAGCGVWNHGYSWAGRLTPAALHLARAQGLFNPTLTFDFVTFSVHFRKRITGPQRLP